MVSEALRIDEISKNDLTARLQQMTGLENPNSVMQMKDYLAENGLETETLGKKEVAAADQNRAGGSDGSSVPPPAAGKKSVRKV